MDGPDSPMHKDPNLVKRNSLVIPGGLLVLLSVVGMVYVAGVRDDNGTCEDGSLIVLAGACRPALLVLAIPLVIGLALVAVGALKFKSVTTCRLGHGSWAHFGLAVLITLVVLPALMALLAPALLGQSDPSLVRGGVAYPLRTILGGLSAIGLLALLPFAALYSARNRANPCCAEKGCFEPCFCDEPVEGPSAGSAAAEPLPEAAAPAAVTAWEEAPAPTPVPEPEPMAVPAEAAPAAEWEVVPDEEPAPAAEPAPPLKAGRAAPALASRPSDPAAPPQDAMAVAAKWAAEDEEAEEELDGSDKPARKYRSGHSKGAPAKKPAKKPSKK
jgi:hypothetical protein